MPENQRGSATRTAAPVCPSWCTFAEHHNDTEHQGAGIAFTGPGDETGHFDDGEPYEVLWAAIDSTDGQPPRIYFDTQGLAAGTRLDVAAADTVLAGLRLYVARFEQLRNQLAKLTKGEQR
ncbi:DUF6907 domain-containing protein [Streptomyces niveiscabiei]|uniref:DUF6907 domain-containing protein n=1 Tax=Streptomyces niveiscabiei TaxID=164115 RepID=UPI0006EB7084|nr:hypothetical protein [Streptomyces niveiscabiei]